MGLSKVALRARGLAFIEGWPYEGFIVGVKTIIVQEGASIIISY